MLVTSTPELGGRSFGTNVMEALLVAYAEADSALTREQYNQLLAELEFVPRIVDLHNNRRKLTNSVRVL